MALKSSTDDIDAIRDQVDRVFTATHATRKEMLRHRRLFEGDLWNLNEPEFDSFDKSGVQYNVLFSTIQQVAPLLMDNRPRARVIPKWPFMSRPAEALNNVLKYAWDTYELPMKLYEYVLDGFISKFGVMKVWCDKDRGHVFEVIDPIDFYIAPGYSDPWEAPWCGTRSLRPLSWAQEMFPDVKKIQPEKGKGEDHEMERAFKYSGANPSDVDTEWVEITEHWMRDGAMVDETQEDGTRKKVPKYPHGKLVWFTPQQKLHEMAAADVHGKAPYVLYKGYIRPHDVTGMSEIEMVEGLHKDINLMLKTYSDHIRHYSNQNELVDTTSGFDVEVYKANRTRGGQAFGWNSRNGVLKPPVSKIEDPMPNPLMGELIRAFVSIVEDVSGVTETLKGQVGKTERQSAVELGILDDRSNTRTRQKLRNLESSLKRISWLFLSNIMQYQAEPDYFPYTEQNGVGYQMYGNSRAQMDMMLKPKEDPELAKLMEWSKQSGIPITNEGDKERIRKGQQEMADYLDYIQKFGETTGENEFDPVYFPFIIQIDADSMLPMDQQSRANILIRLLQTAPPEARAKMFALVLEQLQVKNADEVIEAMEQVMQAAKQQKMAAMKQKMSPEDQAAAARNPEQFEKYTQEVTNG